VASEKTIERAIDILEKAPNKNSDEFMLLGALTSFSINFYPGRAAVLSPQAKEFFLKSVELDKNNLRAYYGLARSDYYKPKEYGGGLVVEENLLKALSLNAKTSADPLAPSWGREDTYVLLINFYLREDRKQEATLFIRKGLKEFPQNAQLIALNKKTSAMKPIAVLISICLSLSSFSQKLIQGIVLGSEGKPVPLANIYLKDIFDGAIANDFGKFSFQTNGKGAVTLIVSAVGFRMFEQSIKNKKPAQAQEVVLKLSDLLSHQLYDNTKEQIELKKEVENLRNYIELEKIRNQDSVLINYEFPANLKGERIAPMLLLPLIENAFKHGNTSATKTCFINCSLDLHEHVLHFHCENSFQNNAAAKENSGIGLYNVKRRLELLYPNSHEFNVLQSDSIYQLNLTINLDEN
jgi:hypothetical protein